MVVSPAERPRLDGQACVGSKSRRSGPQLREGGADRLTYVPVPQYQPSHVPDRGSQGVEEVGERTHIAVGHLPQHSLEVVFWLGWRSGRIVPLIGAVGRSGQASVKLVPWPPPFRQVT